MPTYDYTCETCGHQGRAWRTKEQGPPLFCSRDCRKRSKKPIRRRKPNKWAITPDMHDEIMAVYQGDTGDGQVRDMAIRLGLPRWKVTRCAIDNGWTAKQKKEPDWSEKELKILERNAHLTPSVIQRRLRKYGYHRSEVGIVIKRKRMRFLQNLNGHSARTVSECFGIDIHSVARYIEKGWLKAQKRGTYRTAAQGGDIYYIKDKWIKDFIIENVAVIDFRKVDKYWLVNLLTGKAGNLETEKRRDDESESRGNGETAWMRGKNKRREHRAFAALHCVHYSACLNKAAKQNGRLQCHQCEKLKFVSDNYQKEIGLHSINHYNEGEQIILIDYDRGTRA